MRIHLLRLWTILLILQFEGGLLGVLFLSQLSLCFPDFPGNLDLEKDEILKYIWAYLNFLLLYYCVFLVKTSTSPWKWDLCQTFEKKKKLVILKSLKLHMHLITLTCWWFCTLTCTCEIFFYKTGTSLEEEHWQAQFGQVTRPDEDSLSNIQAINLWDWSLVKGSRKEKKHKVTRLVGRLVKSSAKLHPSMPSSGSLLRTAPVCEAHLDLVQVKSGLPLSWFHFPLCAL